MLGFVPSINSNLRDEPTSWVRNVSSPFNGQLYVLQKRPQLELTGRRKAQILADHALYTCPRQSDLDGVFKVMVTSRRKIGGLPSVRAFSYGARHSRKSINAYISSVIHFALSDYANSWMLRNFVCSSVTSVRTRGF